MTLKRCRWLMLLPAFLLCAGCRKAAPAGGQPPAKEDGQAVIEGKGIVWAYHDLTSALAEAKTTKKPIMMDVFATWCGPCKLLDQNVFSRSEVGEASKAFVTVKIDGDQNESLKRHYRVAGYPTVLFLAPDGKEIGRSYGAVSYDIMLEVMAKAQEKFAGGASTPANPPQSEGR